MRGVVRVVFNGRVKLVRVTGVLNTGLVEFVNAGLVAFVLRRTNLGNGAAARRVPLLRVVILDLRRLGNLARVARVVGMRGMVVTLAFLFNNWAETLFPRRRDKPKIK